MRNIGQKRLLKLFTGIAFLLTTVSCSEEVEVNKPNSKSEASVTFSLQVPGASRPETRALDGDAENSVQEIDILAFKKDGGEYVYKASCNDISGTSNKKTFTIKLRQGEYDLVILANARAIVNNAPIEGLAKTEALALLTAAMPEGGKWIANTGASSYMPFPMWGDVGNVTVNAQTNENKSAVLTRMTARVDVLVTGDAANNFKLTSVHVYNYNTEGALVPVSWDKTNAKATAPNIPESSTLTMGPIIYNNAEINTVENQCTNEVYLFEADNHTGEGEVKESADRTCLVVGGIWDADADSKFDEEPTYYRMDFSMTKDDSQIYLDVLRNHKYIFNITKVSGSGEENPETAFKSVPVNIEAEVLEWNEVDGGDIIFDGQNYLSITPEMLFEFMGNAETKSVKVKTDVADGFKIIKITEDNDGEVTSNPNWLAINKEMNKFYGQNEEAVIIDISVLQNSTAASRKGYIYIKAGRLEAKLIVTQSNVFPVSVKIVKSPTDLTEINELIFSSKDPTSQSFTVNWLPPTADLTITSEATGIAFPASSGTPQAGIETGGNNGTITYTFTPPAFTDAENNENTDDPFLEKVSKVTFTTTNGVDNASASIFLRQKKYNLISDVEPEYTLNSSSQAKTIHIRANFDWKITYVADPGNILENAAGLIDQLGYSDTGQGYPLSLTLAAGNKDVYKQGTATITFVSLVDNTSTWTVQITAKDPDLYVGYFGGELKEKDGVWKYTRKLYVQHADEGAVAWSTEESTIGTTDLIDGKRHTLKLNAAIYPAAYLCIQKNNDFENITSVDDANYRWYLPAKRQLMAIWVANSSFESNYRLSSTNYWSSTEESKYDSWSTRFLLMEAFTDHHSKKMDFTVRCVREY